MKKIILILLLPFCAIAQHSFEANDNHVEWKQIFKDTVKVDLMQSHLQSVFNHEGNIIVSDQVINGTTEFMPIVTDLSDLSPAFRQPLKLNYKIEFKEGRYRVFVNNITFKGIPITIYGVTNYDHYYADTTLIRTRDGELRKNKQAQRILTRMHDAFIKLFTYKAPDKW